MSNPKHVEPLENSGSKLQRARLAEGACRGSAGRSGEVAPFALPGLPARNRIPLLARYLAPTRSSRARGTDLSCACTAATQGPCEGQMVLQPRGQCARCPATRPGPGEAGAAPQRGAGTALNK